MTQAKGGKGRRRAKGPAGAPGPAPESFFEAALAGRLEEVEGGLASGVDPNARQSRGATALLFAAHAGHREIVERLLAHGADPHLADGNGYTALMVAAKAGHDAIVRLLIEVGASLDARAEHDLTALILATQAGRASVVGLLLDKGANPSAASARGASALLFAVSAGLEEIARLLLQHGADVDAADTERGMTPLMAAAASGHEGVVEALLAAGADVFVENDHHQDALAHAKAGEHDAIVALLEQAQGRQAEASPEKLRKLNGARLLDLCSFGDTYLDAGRGLLEQGADLEVKDQRGFTPLLMAAYCRGAAMARALVEHGADLDAAEATGGTALYWAVFGGDPDLARMFLDRGARLTPKVWQAAESNGGDGVIDVLIAVAEARTGSPAPPGMMQPETRRQPFSQYRSNRDAMVSLIRNDPKAAKAAAQLVVFFDPEDALAWLILGTACEATGDHEQAQRILAAAPGRDFGRPQIAEVQDFLKQLLRRSELGLMRYGTEFARPWAGEDPDELFAAAVARGSGGDAAGAREILRKVVALRPEHYDAWFNLGLSYVEAGEPGEAITCYERALSISPDNHTVHYHLGVAREQAGDPTGALKAYEDAKRTRPEWGGQRDHGEQVAEALARLRKPRTYLKGGHKRDVECVAFSADGTLLASGSLDRTIRIWDVAAGQTLLRLGGHANGVNSVAFSPDGTLLASWECLTNVYVLWDLSAGGRRIRSWNGGSQSVWQIAFSPDGRSLAVEADGVAVALFDVATRAETKRLTGHSEEITCVAFHPNGRLLASGSRDRTVRLWDLDTGLEIARLEGHTAVLGSVAFSPDGRLLATGGYDGLVSIREVEGGNEVRPIRLEAGGVRSIHFGRDGRSVYFKSRHDVQACDLESGALRWLLPDAGVVSAFAVSPDERLLATGHSEYQDQRLHLWDVATGRQLWKI